jgi:hypothetical protein
MNLVIADAAALNTIAHEGKLGLLENSMDIMVSDYAIAKLGERWELNYALDRAIKIVTGVPGIASDLKALDIDPEIESVRRVIEALEGMTKLTDSLKGATGEGLDHILIAPEGCR